MTRLLITGAGSYIGGAVAAYWQQATGRDARTVDVRGEDWKQVSFQGYDALLHVAGIAHRREAPGSAQEYYAVNRDLAVAVARKAKAQGVKQFIFLSSMSVYGLTTGHITAQSVPAPDTHYGKSKLQAEEALWPLAEEGFAVAVLRPPMIYGKGCRGNYPRLSALVRKAPFFPSVGNRRSLLYMDCLSAFLVRLIHSGRGGLFFPQNREYVGTDDLVREIARAQGRKIWQPKGLGWLLGLLAPEVKTVGKLFGSLTYDLALSQEFAQEGQMDFAETIRRTEERP